jgi:hypothetical protein
MIRLPRWLLCLVFLSLPLGLVQAQSFTASVDRNGLSLSETLELTLESDNGTVFSKPDLSPLEPLFEVLGTRQVNRLTSIEGKSRAVTRWIITLQPRQEGFVVIPPLRLGELQTEPISLQVRKAEASETGKLAPVFIDASLDQESVYVQAQAVLTLRIYHSVSLYDDSNLSPLQMPEARVEQLGEPRTYEKLINGVRHGVIELRYALFPLQSGELLVPAQVFSATAAQRSSSRDINPFAPPPGKPIRVRSPVIPLQVKAKPASYPADQPWLPARSLSLAEKWSPDPSQVKVGESLTREWVLNVEGLSSAQLPPLVQPAIEGMRRYPDQPQLSDQAGERGLSSQRAEREALLATRSGTVQVPGVEVIWWNTETDQLERTRLPAQQLQIAGNPALEAERQATAGQDREPTSVRLWPWQLSTLLLAITTLLGFFLWWRARQQPAVLRTAPSGPSPRSLLDELKRACQANDPQATRQALDAWARQFPETLAEMAARFEPLSLALDELNGALYSESGQYWQGGQLWQAIRDLPTEQRLEEHQQEATTLPPLYPR